MVLNADTSTSKKKPASAIFTVSVPSALTANLAIPRPIIPLNTTINLANPITLGFYFPFPPPYSSPSSPLPLSLLFPSFFLSFPLLPSPFPLFPSFFLSFPLLPSPSCFLSSHPPPLSPFPLFLSFISLSSPYPPFQSLPLICSLSYCLSLSLSAS